MKYSPQSCHNPHRSLYLAEFSDCCLSALGYCSRMVLFPLINLLLSQGKSACALWLVAGTRAPCKAGSALSRATWGCWTVYRFMQRDLRGAVVTGRMQSRLQNPCFCLRASQAAGGYHILYILLYFIFPCSPAGDTRGTDGPWA